jgi:polysaccharide export outer membrane protein
MLKKLIFLLITGISLLSSCVTSSRLNYLQESSSPYFREAIIPDDYKVQIFDELFIQVITLDEISSSLFNLGNSVQGVSESKTYTIFEDGCIDFPFVGRIKVVDKTIREISGIVQDELKGYIKGDYNVQARLGNSSFSVIGPGGKVGRYEIEKEKLNIFQALSMAGDLGDYAERARIKILRQTPEGTQLRSFNIKTKDIMKTEFFYVQPNDIIYVEMFKGQFFQMNSLMTSLTLFTTTATTAFAILRLIDRVK